MRAGVTWAFGKSFEMPAECPACGTPVVEEGKYFRCPNTTGCRPQIVGRTLQMASRAAFDVDGIGEKMVEQLVDVGQLETPADLFHLDPEVLVELERWGQKTVDNLRAQLDEKRHVPFDRFLVSLSIPDVGSGTARLLARNFESLDALRDASQEDLEQVDGIGPEVGAGLVAWFEEPVNQALVERLFEGGVELTYPGPAATDGVFAGKSVVFTGTLEGLTRAEAKKIVEDQGGARRLVDQRQDGLPRPGRQAREQGQEGGRAGRRGALRRGVRRARPRLAPARPHRPVAQVGQVARIRPSDVGSRRRPVPIPDRRAPAGCGWTKAERSPGEIPGKILGAETVSADSLRRRSPRW